MKKEKIFNAQNPFLQKVCTIFAYYLAIGTIFPQMRIMPGYKIFMFLAMFLWLIFAIFAHPSFFTRLSIHKFFIFIFILYTVVTPYLFGNGTIGNRYLEQSIMFIFYLIYQYNNTYGFTNSSKAIVKWSLPFIIFTSIITLKGLIKMPYLARSIKSSGEDTMLLRSQGIGGYELIYFLVFVSIILFFILNNWKLFNLSVQKKILIIMLFILFVLTVVYANYFTALLMMIISFTTIIVTKNKNLLTKIFFTVIGIIFLIFSKSIFIIMSNWLINFLGEGATVQKLLNIQAEILGYGGGESIFLGRAWTIEASWNAFLHNPISGIIVNSIQFGGNYLIGFGQHSYFMDTLALYGMFIGIVNIYIVLQPFFIQMKKNNVLYGLNLSMIISTLMLLGMNNATTSIGFAIFFLYPVFCDWASSLEKKNKIVELQY